MSRIVVAWMPSRAKQRSAASSRCCWRRASDSGLSFGIQNEQPFFMRSQLAAQAISGLAAPDRDLEVVGLREPDRVIGLGGKLALAREALAERLLHGAVEQ